MMWFQVYVVFCLSISSIAYCYEDPTIVRFKLDLINNEINTKYEDGRRRYDNAKEGLRIKNQYPILFNKEHRDLNTSDTSDTSDTRNFPYIAAIIINGRLWCAGTIVDVNWILTAAHCLNYVLHVSPTKTLQKYVKIRVGSTKPHEGGTLVEVAGAVRHPKFEEEPVPHADIALIKLAVDLVFSPFVNLIKIYEDTKEPYPQSFILVAGWGATRGSEAAFRDHTPDLMSTRLKVRTRSYCQDAYQLVNGFQFTADFFCASLRNGTRDACLFDAGAPAIQQNRLMGLMSFGPERCGHEFQPAVFIKAFYFRDFVRTTIASYKTTAELIEAMRLIDPAALPDVSTEPVTKEPAIHFDEIEEVTRPDSKHDK